MSVRGSGRAAGNVFPYSEYINIHVLSPEDPVVIAPGEAELFELSAAEAVDREPGVRLAVQANGVLEPDELEVRLNGILLEDFSVDSTEDAGQRTFVYDVRPRFLEKGINEIRLSPSADSRGVFLEDLLLETEY